MVISVKYDLNGQPKALKAWALIGVSAVGLSACNERAPLSNSSAQVGQIPTATAPYGPVVVDVAEAGAGYFQVQHDGKLAYSRCGAFSQSSFGYLTLKGDIVIPEVIIPSGSTQVEVNALGRVFAQAGSATSSVPIGQLNVFVFQPDAALTPIGGGLDTSAAQPIQTFPSADGSGALVATNSAC